MFLFITHESLCTGQWRHEPLIPVHWRQNRQISMSSRLTSSTEGVAGQSGVYSDSETLSLKTKNKKTTYKNTFMIKTLVLRAAHVNASYSKNQHSKSCKIQSSGPNTVPHIYRSTVVDLKNRLL